jgi:hypothetical protein
MAAAKSNAAVIAALASAALAAARAAAAAADAAIAVQAVDRLVFHRAQSAAHVGVGPADPVVIVSVDEGVPAVR